MTYMNGYQVNFKQRRNTIINRVMIKDLKSCPTRLFYLRVSTTKQKNLVKLDISTDTTVNIIIITPIQTLNNTPSHYQPFYSFHHLFIIIQLNHSYSSYHILTTSATPILLIFNYTYFLYILYIILFNIAKNIKIDNTFDHVQSAILKIHPSI